jgi:lipoprotein signal peptidase
VRAIEADPQAGVQAEINRMTKVNGAWHLYLVMWGLFGVAGLLLRFATSSEFFRGVGIALVFIAGVGLLVDGFAERRTHPYVDALQGHSRPAAIQ